MRTTNATSDPFDPRNFAGLTHPLTQATNLPPYCYTSREWFDREVETIFLREWIWLAREEQVPNPGDYLRVDWMGEPIVIVRGRDGEVRAFSASCRHKGTEICMGQGHRKSFACPYHGWTYSLTGELIGVPGMKEAEHFDRSQYGLIPIRLDRWGGFIFVNFDPDARPLHEALGGMAERFSAHRLEEMRVARQVVNRVGCNWKIWAENSREGYHPDVVHKETYNRYLAGRTRGGWVSSGGTEVPGRPYRAWDMISGANDDGLWMPQNGRFPSIEGLSGYDRDSTHFLIWYPLFLLNLAPAVMGLHQLFPIGPNETVNVTWICFSKSTMERPDFQEHVGQYCVLPEAILPEDKTACELTQRGLESRLATIGRYDVEERPCYLFHHYVLDRVLGHGWHRVVARAKAQPTGGRRGRRRRRA